MNAFFIKEGETCKELIFILFDVYFERLVAVAIWRESFCFHLLLVAQLAVHFDFSQVP